MEEPKEIREKIAQMAELALAMLKATFDGFIKHEPDILNAVLKDEEKLNAYEKEITASLIDISKGKAASSEKKNIACLVNIVTDLEEIGDYIKDMIERIEIKIEEHLLFSEKGLAEYKHLYNVTETGLQDIVSALKMDDRGFAKRPLCDEGHVDTLVEKYRNAHAERLMSGVCDLRAGNMFLNLLDFTAQIAHHTQAIAKNILGQKW